MMQTFINLAATYSAWCDTLVASHGPLVATVALCWGLFAAPLFVAGAAAGLLVLMSKTETKGS